MKEILNSDGQQFFQYHQNEPILTSSSNIKKKSPRHMASEIQVLASDIPKMPRD